MRDKIFQALSMDNLESLIKDHSKEFDVIISGGGFYAFYVMGVDRVLKKIQQEGMIKIRRYAGVSAGAIIAVLMQCNHNGVEIVHHLHDKLAGQSDFFVKLREQLLLLFPKDAYLQCSGNVFIHLSEVTWYGLRPCVISQFESNEDLVDACMASANMPFIISPSFFYRYRDRWYMDGCLTRILPTFSDSASQLLIKLYRIDYGWNCLYSPVDRSIEGLIVKGAVETASFFRTDDHRVVALEWYLVKMRKYKIIRRYVMLGITTVVTGLAIRRWVSSSTPRQ